jgi:isoquinoline 1-oxidoreductase beta subunit
VEKIKINQTRVGGGFGRRLMNDYACEAGAIAQRCAGPVKLIWTREQDMAHDFYRPGGFHALSGGLDAAGKLVAWRNHFITFSTDGTNPVSGGNMPAEEFPAQNLPNYLLTQTMLPLATPCGPWRAPRSCSSPGSSRVSCTSSRSPAVATTAISCWRSWASVACCRGDSTPGVPPT